MSYEGTTTAGSGCPDSDLNATVSASEDCCGVTLMGVYRSRKSEPPASNRERRDLQSRSLPSGIGPVLPISLMWGISGARLPFSMLFLAFSPTLGATRSRRGHRAVASP